MGEFEKDIRDMFKDLEIQINTDDLWNNIQPVLDKKDRRYPPVWWILSGIILVMSLATIIYLNTVNKNNDLSNKKRNNIISINKNDTTAKSLRPTVPITKDTLEQSNDKNNKEDNHKNRKKKNYTPVAIENTKKNLDETTTIAVDKSLTQLPTAANKDDNKSISYFAKLDVNNFIKYTKQYTLPRLQIIQSAKRTNPAKAPKFALKRSIDVAFGGSMINKTLTLRDDKFAGYRQKRIDTEKYLESMNAGIYLNFKHKTGIFITTGIDITVIDEKFADKDSIDILKTKKGTVKEIIDENGNVAYQNGQKEFNTHKVWDKLIYNYYGFIDIPLTLGYAFETGKIKTEIHSGLSYNLAFLKRGQIIGQDGYPVHIDKEENLFKSGSGFSLLAGIKIMVPYKNNMFYVEPNIKYNLNSITDDKYPIEQKYFNYGVKVGYRFSKR